MQDIRPYQKPTPRPVIVEQVEVIVVEPLPMIRPIEALTPEEKVAVLERALFRARQEARLERRSGRRRIFSRI